MSSGQQKQNQQRTAIVFRQLRGKLITALVLIGIALLSEKMSGGDLWSLGTEGVAAKQSQPARASTQTQADGYAFSLTGTVDHVADGDTLTLQVGKRQERVRLASIDAPETDKGNGQRGQAMAQQSRKALENLVSGKRLTLQCYEQDHYQRNICDVMLPGGGTANQKQVALGMAWANMEKGGRFLRDDSLKALESEARRKHLGIWQSSKPIQPWVWRYQCWQKGKCS